MPIPDTIYNHIRYSSGGDAAGPCARMGSYTLHQVFNYPSWCVFVVAFLAGKPIALRDVPASTADDWTILG